MNKPIIFLGPSLTHEKARKILNEALNDKNEEVRKSAIVALANLDYISVTKKNNEFTKMTGG